MAEDARNPMPVFVDLDGTRAEGLWAIVDHLETNYPDHPLAPADAAERRACLRWLDWAMGPFHEQVTQRIVYEKAGQRFTGAPGRRAPDMNVIRAGREELKLALAAIGRAAEDQRQSGRPRRHRWAIWRWRRICRRWIISAKCRGANFPPPANGMCG